MLGNKYVGKTSILKCAAKSVKKHLSNWSGRSVTLDKSMGELRKELIFEEKSYQDHHADQNYDIILACYSPTDPGLCFDFFSLKNTF